MTHTSNFGVFASPERQPMFDINDFDETLPGPWEWDLKRLGASLEVAGRGRGYSAAERRTVVLAEAGEYRARMKEAGLGRDLPNRRRRRIRRGRRLRATVLGGRYS